MKNLFAMFVIIVFTAVNVYAEKADLNSISELQPCPQHITLKKGAAANKFARHHGIKKHRGKGTLDRMDGINFGDDAVTYEGFEFKNYGKPAGDIKAEALIRAPWSRERGLCLSYESAASSYLTNQQRK